MTAAAQGRALLGALRSAAEERGCDRLTLNCKEENAPFYEKCGFARADEQCYAIYF